MTDQAIMDYKLNYPLLSSRAHMTTYSFTTIYPTFLEKTIINTGIIHIKGENILPAVWKEVQHHACSA